MSTTFDLENLTPVEFKTEAKPLEDVFSMLLRKRTEFTPVQVEACGAATNRLRQGSFTSAINTAFSLHRELILSPDHLWLFLMQGFSNHINTHAETLRNCFVTHEGKKTLSIERDDFKKGARDNPWNEVFAMFGEQIHENTVGDVYDLFVADFSTTTILEKATYEVTLMASMKEYFALRMRTWCGIPRITLEGTPSDWQEIATRIQRLRAYDLGWWIDVIEPVIDQFVRASSGDIDSNFWRRIYKDYDMSGGPYINGWIVKLIPYFLSGSNSDGEPLYVANDVLDKLDEPDYKGVTSARFPRQWVQVPFEWMYHGRPYNMRFTAGFIGVSEHPQTLAIRPEVGWAVHDVDVYLRLKEVEEEKYINELKKRSKLHAKINNVDDDLNKLRAEINNTQNDQE